MITTLIKTLTADDDATVSFVDGTDSVVLDNTYDQYMFVCTDINPADDDANFTFQMNVAGGADYNETMTTTYFLAYNPIGGGGAAIGYRADLDQAQGTGFQCLFHAVGNATDESTAGILHLFSPSSTTYVKHFYSRFVGHAYHDYVEDEFAAGYFNLTGAVDEIQFKMDSGNFDGVIQMYGIA